MGKNSYPRHTQLSNIKYICFCTDLGSVTSDATINTIVGELQLVVESRGFLQWENAKLIWKGKLHTKTRLKFPTVSNFEVFVHEHKQTPLSSYEA